MAGLALRSAVMLTLPNLMSDISPTLPDEFVEILLQTPNVRIERIVSQGHSSPDEFWYDQATHEWVLLVHGAAQLQFEGEAA